MGEQLCAIVGAFDGRLYAFFIARNKTLDEIKEEAWFKFGHALGTSEWVLLVGNVMYSEKFVPAYESGAYVSFSQEFTHKG